MEVKIRSYVDELFKSAPKCPKADEVKEEIYSNLLDKYNGLLEKGVSEQEAYENIKNSVGDVDELIQSIKEENAGYGNVYTDEEIKNIKKGYKIEL